MHPIQSHILRQLMFATSCRYSDLKPEGVEGNLFMYHFRKVEQEGWITKKGQAYILTPEGRKYVARLSLQTLTPRLQPTIATFIAYQNEKGEWLLHERSRQPFIGQKTFPYGKMHWGESLSEAAAREFKDKTGLSGEVRYHTSTYLRVVESGVLTTHMLCHIFLATNVTGKLKAKAVKGKCAFEKVENPAAEGYLPGFAEMFELVTQPPTSEPRDFTLSV